MNGEQLSAPTPEQMYEQMTGKELVQGYLSDAIPGQAVMGRLLDDIDLADIAETGIPVGGDEIKVEDYLEVARKHEGALSGILKFVALDEKDEKTKEAMRRMILGYINR